MGLSFACRDIGEACDFVARGETEEEVFAQAAKHAKEVHGYTDAQINDPETQKEVKKAIKRT
jgi:predicted small metal-binding protein